MNKSKKVSGIKNLFSNVNISVLFKILTFLVVPAALVLSLYVSFRNNVKKAKDTFSEQTVSLSDKITEGAYNLGEKNNHVSNEISVAINDAIEDTRLEVLTVRDVEYITDETNSSGTVTSWLKVTGEGVYTIDLKTAEYLYDSITKTITVILRKPELTHCRLVNGENIFYQDNRLLGDGKIIDGEDLAQRQIQKGYIETIAYFQQNPYFFESAKKSGEIFVTNIIKQLYQNNPEINVEIVFI